MPAHQLREKLDRNSDPPGQHPLADQRIDVALTFSCLSVLPILRKRPEAATGRGRIKPLPDRDEPCWALPTADFPASGSRPMCEFRLL
jgi:hypothetical protein